MKKIISRHQTIGIIGLAKNTGKTTTLNHLIKQLKDDKIGLTSIGLDGEELDQVTKLPKPRIKLRPGMIIATAKQCITDKKLVYRIIEETRMQTALGPVMIIEIMSKGKLVVAGPTTNKELDKVIKKLRKHAEKVLIDGAFNRMTFVSLDQIDAIILTTGASVHYNMKKTIAKTKRVMDSFAIKPTTKLKRLPDSPMILQTATHIVAFKDKRIETIQAALKMFDEPLEMMYVQGAVTETLIDYFIEASLRGFNLICDDATKLLVSEPYFDYLHKLGITLNVINHCPLVALTINPTSPTGHDYDADVFLKEMQKVTALPVFDVMRKETGHVKTKSQS